MGQSVWCFTVESWVILKYLDMLDIIEQSLTHTHTHTHDVTVNGHKLIKHKHTALEKQMSLTCSVLSIGPHQVFALGHDHREALCCWQIAERQQDLSNCIHSLCSHMRAWQTLNTAASLGELWQKALNTVGDSFILKQICAHVLLESSSCYRG